MRNTYFITAFIFINTNRGWKVYLKRVYEERSHEDGFRVLADRLWPRGIKKENLGLDLWAKEIAPSTELRKRYHQDGNFEALARII